MNKPKVKRYFSFVKECFRFYRLLFRKQILDEVDGCLDSLQRQLNVNFTNSHWDKILKLLSLLYLNYNGEIKRLELKWSCGVQSTMIFDDNCFPANLN